MNYHIDTILLWDSFKADCECPLCLIHAKCESDFVDSALGGSVMEPDRRIEVNKLGFCREHLTLLYAGKNRLGLALMAHSHLKEIIGEQKQLTVKLNKQLNKRRRAHLLGLGARPQGDGETGDRRIDSLDELISATVQRCGTCFICSRLESSMERYVNNTLALWADDQEFKNVFEGGKGFCVPHYAQMLAAAKRQLRHKKRGEFLRALIKVQETHLERIERELEWYTLKHDYRNKEEPWGASKDAVERTLGKLRGWSKK